MIHEVVPWGDLTGLLSDGPGRSAWIYAPGVIEHHRLGSLTDDDRHGLEALCLVAQAADGHRPLSDDLWHELTGPATAGAQIVLDRRDGHLVGSAHISHAPGHWQLEFVVHPRHRHAGIERQLLERAVAEIASDGGGAVVLWADDPDATTAAMIQRLGFAPQRDLLRMECALPLDDAHAWPDGIRARPFRPGDDDAEWLALNNLAFSGHPEQGVWSQHTLDERVRQEWFDPDGFIVAEDDTGIAGFCWTKIHDDEQAGEIYVIGVHPDRQGIGLGRALVLAGLESIANHGMPTAILYVDASNDAAVGLYESLGFTTTRTNRAFAIDIADATSAQRSDGTEDDTT